VPRNPLQYHTLQTKISSHGHNHDSDNHDSDGGALKLPPLLPLRTDPFSLSKTFGFVHISKCAGASWIVELMSLMTQKNLLYPNNPQGDEHSVAWQRTNHPSNYLLTAVKSPRHHVWSLFTECKYDQWGKGVTANTGFPNSRHGEFGDLEDFEEWLDHFVQPGSSSLSSSSASHDDGFVIHETTRNHFNCYHPANYISRAFDVNDRNPHNVQINGRFEPDISMVNKTYWELDMVGIAELFDEQKCLIYHRVATHPNATEEMNAEKRNEIHRYLDTQCVCPKESNTTASVHVTHHEEGHRKSMRDGVPKRIRNKIQALTRVDVELYKIALVEFLQEIVWMEDQLGRRVMCENKFETLDYELEYLGLGKISKLYHTIQELRKRKQ